jgi:ABC-type transporter Mla subunit MlaD
MTIDERIEFLMQSIESHDKQLGELTDGLSTLKQTVAAQSANIDKLITVSNQDADAIRRLAAVAQAHQERLDRIDPA